MYESYFGLKEAPFSIAPNPHYLYMSRQHNEALAHLIYGVEREGGFILLTGEVGTGKTTICRCFLEQVPENVDVAFILNPKLDSEQLLETICDELSIGYIGDSLSIKDYTDYINQRLLRSHSKGRHTVIIIDEAQNLSPTVLEQLRLLTNLETHEKKLLQIILLGQPELQDIFLKPELRQLSQRVTARFHLDALTKEEIAPYVYHRLAVAGCAFPEMLFPEKTIHKLYSISKGIPRVINLVCDRSLLGAYAENKKCIENPLLQKAAKEVLGKSLVLHKDEKAAFFKSMIVSNNWIAILGLCIACLTLGIVLSAFFIEGASKNQIIGATQAPIDLSKESLIDTPTDLPPASLISSKTEFISSQISDDSAGKSAGESVGKSAEVGVAASSDVDLAVEHSIKSNDMVGFDDLLAKGELNKQLSYVSLMRLWGIQYRPEQDGFACKYAKANGVTCLSKIGSVGVVAHLGLPAILTLFDSDGGKHFVVARSVNDESVQLIVNDVEVEMSISELHKHWRGHFVVLWKRPPQYVSPLKPGTIGPMTKWLGKQLDIYEGVKHPSLGRSYYDDALVQRVKAFQKQVGEQADGIAGVNTLIMLSNYTEKNIPSFSVNRETM
jgi:general secretion pathway protein A